MKRFFIPTHFKIIFSIAWFLASFLIFGYEISRSVECFMSLGCRPTIVDTIFSLLSLVFLFPVLILKEFVTSMVPLFVSQALYAYLVTAIADFLLPKTIKKYITWICSFLIVIGIVFAIYLQISFKINENNHIQEISSKFYTATGKKAEDLFIIKSYGKVINQIYFAPQNTYTSYYITYYDPQTAAPVGDISIMSPKVNTPEAVEQLLSWYTSLNTSGYYQNKKVMIGNNAVILQTADGEEWRFTWKTDQYVITIMGLDRTVVKDYLKKYPSKIEVN